MWADEIGGQDLDPHLDLRVDPILVISSPKQVRFLSLLKKGVVSIGRVNGLFYKVALVMFSV